MKSYLNIMRECCFRITEEADVVEAPEDGEEKKEMIRDGICKEMREKYGLDACQKYVDGLVQDSLDLNIVLPVKDPAIAAATGYLVERTKNLPMVKTSGTADLETEKGAVIFKEQHKYGMISEASSAVNSFLSDLNRTVVQLIPVIIGGALVQAGRLDTGDVVNFIGFATGVASYISIFVLQFGNIKNEMGNVERILEILDCELEDAGADANLDIPDADISFERVGFAYKEGSPVLKDLSCVIPQGKITAVIGANGSGKSTLFKLLGAYV